MPRHGRTEAGIDIYVAGPPCQPWSQNNVRAEGEADPRGQLFSASLLFITEARPRAFIVENVCGLIRRCGGKYLGDTLETLRKGGYHVQRARLNTLDMGLPPNRPRLYLWGLRSDLGSALPAISTGRAQDALELSDILGGGKHSNPRHGRMSISSSPRQPRNASST